MTSQKGWTRGCPRAGRGLSPPHPPCAPFGCLYRVGGQRPCLRTWQEGLSGPSQWGICQPLGQGQVGADGRWTPPAPNLSLGPGKSYPAHLPRASASPFPPHQPCVAITCDSQLVTSPQQQSCSLANRHSRSRILTESPISTVTTTPMDRWGAV